MHALSGYILSFTIISKAKCIIEHEYPFLTASVVFLDRFERALNSARETLKRARQRFPSTAIATEQKELFGYGDQSSKLL